ncbi:MAG TPA: beta-propeller domain-containing protein, partial [Polyangia bacterium]|nr:beta-propeller domain-containing protein [Polyangia bacterium]
MNRTPLLRALALPLSTLCVLSACSGNGTTGRPPGNEMAPGQTDFTTEAPGQSSAPGAGAGASDNAAPMAAGGATAATPTVAPGAPGGRVADVQEADIYRMDHNRLFYLNTYRGFMAYDLTDAQKPVLLGRLPVYGYPIEMFVKGNTVYALLSDALYLTQQAGAFQFQRRNVSQLVTIDVSDPGHPQLLKSIDIVGQLREGVSRKIDDTIYVVSSIPQWYWYGWQVPGAQNPNPKEQAWVYSFNVADAQNPQLVQKLEIFEGGSVQFNNNNVSYNRWFNSVQIAATSNALMVVENWSVSVWSQAGGSINGCGSYEDNQLARVSIIDVSDPAGAIRVHTRFETAGSLSDQFKQTYVFDPTTKTGTYYGIFARNVWSGFGCQGGSYTQNTMESWDVTDGANPARLSRLDFGNSHETVRGTAFDVDRQVAYAITARQIDPLYAISFADRANLKVLSQIDGLSGDMTVFRTIGDTQGFLMGIGTDASGTCDGAPVDPSMASAGPVSTNIAVSIIDVRNLAAIHLVQRKCVSIQNAEWVGSQISWNLDQAHKMIGMYSDATANVVTVPIYYNQKIDSTTDSWWWYQWRTAVGIMSWDLTAYDDTKPPAAQTVLQSYGTFVHPNGQVLRSIVFQHEGATPERMMINLSDTHMSVASLADLNKPALQSVVELAPYVTATLRFGDYVVEEIQSQPYYGWTPNQDRTEFRVKPAGGDVELKDPVATFALGQVVRVFKHGDNQLVAIRYIQQQPPTKLDSQWQPPVIEAQVYDMTDPANPRQAGKATLPNDIQLYYGYWCGDWFWGAWGFSGVTNNVISTTTALQILGQSWAQVGNSSGVWTTRLVTLELADSDAPAVTTKVIETTPATGEWWASSYGLSADPVAPDGFYLTYRRHVGDDKSGNFPLAIFKDYAQRWEKTTGEWTGGAAINLPGRLTNTYLGANNQRMFVAQDYRWFWVADTTGNGSGHGDSALRLSLLREATVAGQPAAALLDSKTFDGIYPSSMILQDQKLSLVARHQSYGWYYPLAAGAGGVGVATSGPAKAAALTATTPASAVDAMSDRLLIFDLGAATFASLYDQPTGMYNSDLVGEHDGRMLMNLQGDGFLVVDVSNPAA